MVAELRILFRCPIQRRTYMSARWTVYGGLSQ